MRVKFILVFNKELKETYDADDESVNRPPLNTYYDVPRLEKWCDLEIIPSKKDLVNMAELFSYDSLELYTGFVIYRILEKDNEGFYYEIYLDSER